MEPYTSQHDAFRDTVRRFVERQIIPFVNDWDEAGEFPRDLYRQAADVGMFGIGFPEEYGGIADTDIFYAIIVSQELARAGCGGVAAGLMSHTIGAPPIAAVGSEELKARVLPEILRGDKISALAITEPSAGSDVAALTTRAERDGQDYLVNGTKTLITSGMRADYFTVAVRTGGPGAGGLSLLLIERDRAGFERTELKKMGWWCSDTATLYFDDCRVPATNLIGPEGGGFPAMMMNFNRERIGMAAQAAALARVCLDEAIGYARQRKTFGKRLADHQVIRHKIVEMARKVNATEAFLISTAVQVEDGRHPVAEICQLKVQATMTLEFCAREAMQIFGGAGFVRGHKVERIYREVRVYAIGGGSEEIMRDLAARQMGL